MVEEAFGVSNEIDSNAVEILTDDPANTKTY